jgi:hypothetical protein
VALPTRAPPAALLCRKAFVAALRERFADLDMEYSVGGQISFDVFPRVRAAPAWLACSQAGRAGTREAAGAIRTGAPWMAGAAARLRPGGTPR